MTRMTLKARVDADGVLRVTVPMGLEEADRAVRLTVEPNDLMIAAIARANDLTVVTHNTAEFSRVPGLKLDDWQGP